MLHSQTNIDMMYHHNMLSITVFTLLTSFARKSEIYAKNWLSEFVCQPWPLFCIQRQNYHNTLCIAKQIIEPQTYFSNVQNSLLCVCIYIYIYTYTLKKSLCPYRLLNAKFFKPREIKGMSKSNP